MIPRNKAVVPSGGDDFIWLCPLVFFHQTTLQSRFSFVEITLQTLGIPYCSGNVAFIIHKKGEEKLFLIFKNMYLCMFLYAHTHIYVGGPPKKQVIFWRVDPLY